MPTAWCSPRTSVATTRRNAAAHPGACGSQPTSCLTGNFGRCLSSDSNDIQASLSADEQATIIRQISDLLASEGHNLDEFINSARQETALTKGVELPSLDTHKTGPTNAAL